VKPIGEQSSPLEPLDQGASGFEGVGEICFVSVEGFIENMGVEGGCRLIELFESFA